MALAWFATHYGRPGTPTDQAWIESLFGHFKASSPTSRRSSTSMCSGPNLRSVGSITTRLRFHADMDMSPLPKNTAAKARPSEPPESRVSQKHANGGSPTIKTTNPEDPAMRTKTSGRCDIESDTPQSHQTAA